MSNFRPFFLTLAAFLSLAGCSSVDSTSGAAEVSAEIADTTPTNWQEGFNAGDVEMGWIEAFDDSILTSLVLEAQENSPNLQAAAANLERSWALARQAGAALTPSLGLNADGQNSGNVNGASDGNVNVGLQANWELDLWGRISSGRDAAVESAEAVAADFQFAQYSLAAGVARAYFLAIEAGLQENIAGSTYNALLETQRIVNLQFENGFTDAQAVALTNSDLAVAEDRVISAQAGQRDAVRALELLLGRYPAAELQLRTSLPVVPPSAPAGLPSEILERRPDLIAAERRIAATISNVNQARAARLPQILLTGNLGRSSNDLSNLLSAGTSPFSLATSLLVPLFDGGANAAAIEINTADQEQAVAAYAEAALNAFSDVETTLDQGQVLINRQNALNTASEEADEALRLANISFNVGETDILDVLSIQARVLSAQSNLLSVERSQLEQFIDLNLALGGDWNVE